jgi:hypothetical protein
MMKRMQLSLGRIRMEIDLLDTATAERVWEAAPFEALVNTWGDEVYFRTPAVSPLEADARTVVQMGEIAYWPPGQAIAIGFGPTPISVGDEIRLASAANIFATCPMDLAVLKTVTDGLLVRVSRLTQ